VRSIPIERRRLANGLQVILSPDRRAPIVAVNVCYGVGSKHEQPGKTGFAHLFEHLMFEGSANVAEGEHGSLIEAAGGRFNAGTQMDYTNYFDTLPSNQLELALWLEADRLATLSAAVSQETLDNQRDVVKNERRWRVDNAPYGTWEEKLQGLIYPETHPYHHETLGSMEDLEAASLDDVRSFFETYYSPDNAVLGIVGDFELDTAMAMIERHFGPIPPGDARPPKPDMSLEPMLESQQRDTVPDDVALARVYLGYRIPPCDEPEFDAFEVVADLLATGRASRLFAKLVRQDRLAQDVVASAFPLVDGAATLAIWATASPGVEASQLESALHRELAALADAGPDDAELERVHNMHAAATSASLQEVGERADRLTMYAKLLDEPERINQEIERYDAVMATHVRDAMATYAVPEHAAVLTYLPADSH
jgi:zinc protease